MSESQSQTLSPAPQSRQAPGSVPAGTRLSLGQLSLAVWVLVCAYCTAAGWVLSAVHQLNAAGYGAALVLGLASGGVWLGRDPALRSAWRGTWHRVQRFKRPLPLAFLLLSIGIVLGGLLYPPTNYDGLVYRTPRVLHWLAAGQWHWINTPDARLNIRASGFEWLMAPLLALLRTDRLCFLPNTVSFLLLPGALFMFLRRAGVRPRVAWAWMWVLPAASCYVLQAASIANDAYATVLVLAAINFAFLAVERRRCGWLWLSLLAAGLVSGSKATNATLLLAWGWVALRALPLVRRHPFQLLPVVALTLLVSLTPHVWFNLRHTGSWSGAQLEPATFSARTPLHGVVGNSFAVVAQNLAPPVSPLSASTGERLARAWVPRPVLRMYDAEFETAFGLKVLDGIQTENNAGLGLVLVLLLVGSTAAALWLRARGDRVGTGSVGARLSGLQKGLLFLPWISLLVFMSKVSITQVGRVLSPYYPLLLLPLLLAPGLSRLVRRRGWTVCALAVFGSAWLLLLVSPARPLLPMKRLLSLSHHPGSAVTSALRGYEAYERRNDNLAPLRQWLPADAAVVGFAYIYNDLATSLWRPFGRRRVEYVSPQDSAQELRQRGIRYVVVSGNFLRGWHLTLDGWLPTLGARQVGHLTVERVAAPYEPEDWYVVSLEP